MRIFRPGFELFQFFKFHLFIFSKEERYLKHNSIFVHFNGLKNKPQRWHFLLITVGKDILCHMYRSFNTSPICFLSQNFCLFANTFHIKATRTKYLRKVINE